MPNPRKLLNGRWEATWRNVQGRERSKVFDTKRDADDHLAGVRTAIRAGSYIDPHQAKTLVSTIAATWAAAHPDWAASTRARNASIVDRHILPVWGPVKVGDIDHDGLQRWVGDLAATMAGGTVRKVAGVMSGILEQAVLSRKIATNPMTAVKLPRQKLQPRRYLSGVEVEQFADAAGNQGLTVYVLAYCGLRIGELSALKVGHVDTLRKRFLIEGSVTEVNGELVWSAPKDRQRRSVPYPGFLAASIAELVAGLGPDDLLFQAPRGGVLRVRNMRRDWFDAAAVAAGVPGLTPHELRHTAASLAVSSGASVLALQRMLGHDKPSTTLDVYSDLFDADLDQVADSLHNARAEHLAEFLRSREGQGLRAVATKP